MSITSRINEMSSHIEQAYDELQGLGADLTNVNKNIENISMVLDDIYDSMPQVSGEGTSLTLDNTRVGKIKSTLKGNTSQSGTPTPASPIPVNVVSGDNEINVVGKNLFDKDNLTIEIGTISTAGTFDYSTERLRAYWVEVDENTTYTISTSNSDLQIVPYFYNSSKTFLSFDNGWKNFPYTFTTPANTKYLALLFKNSNNTPSVGMIGNLQLEKGTSATDFELYQGNTCNIDLPSGMELCKIGNYVDFPFHAINGNKYYDSLTQEQKDLLTYDKWYLHKEVGKVVLDGTQTLTYELSLGLDMFKYTNNDMLRGNILDGYCNYYENQKNIGSEIYQDAEFRLGWSSKVMYFMNDTSRFNGSLQNFNNWLTSHNVITYYPLATPTNTEITYQPLIDQLNLLEKAMSKEGQTNISQVNNDLPFIISASALKEWQENTSLNSTLSMVNPLSLGNTLNTQENDIQPIEVDNIEPLEEEENEES